MSSISSISICITSASFCLIASSSSAIYLYTSSLAASYLRLLNSSTFALCICSYLLYFSILMLFSCSILICYYWPLCLFYWPMILAYLASSYLWSKIASWILAFSAFLSCLWKAIFYLVSISLCLLTSSACIFSIATWAFFYFNLWTSVALLLVSSIFFQVFISSCLRRAIRLASNYASRSQL